jgi:hypothetical protein
MNRATPNVIRVGEENIAMRDELGIIQARRILLDGEE